MTLEDALSLALTGLCAVDIQRRERADRLGVAYPAWRDTDECAAYTTLLAVWATENRQRLALETLAAAI